MIALMVVVSVLFLGGATLAIAAPRIVEPDENGYTGKVFTQNDRPLVSTEPEAQNADSRRAPELEELQPDDEEYTGPIVPRVDPVPSTEDEPSNTEVDWDSLYQGPQADISEGVVIDEHGVQWSAFYYAFYPGVALHPRDSSTTWSYSGFGCTSASSGTDLFVTNLNLPEGSRIDYLRIFYYDDSGSNSGAYITSYDASGGHSDLINVASSGDAGYGTALSDYLGHTVTTGNNTYVLLWRPNVTGDSMRLCGLRVAYRLP
jgi:hypothetical protein